MNDVENTIKMMLRNIHAYRAAFDHADHFRVEEVEAFSAERARNAAQALEHGGYCSPLTLERLETEHAAWMARQPFAGQPPVEPLLGIVEEVGELAHAHLKGAQDVRGGEAAMSPKARDAVGDVVIFLVAYCAARGWSLAEIVRETWREVSRRQYSRAGGVVAEEPGV